VARCAWVVGIGCALVLAACGGKSMRAAKGGSDVPGSAAVAAKGPIPSGDWTRFNFNAQRTGVGPSDTGITAKDIGLLRRRQVDLPGTVDASPIELHAVKIGGRRRDVIIVTTTYGRTIALAADSGDQLWQYTPPDIRSYERGAQITNATPIVGSDRRYVYAATPDGRIRKLVLATGQEIRSGDWPVGVTFDARREKLGTALNIRGGSLIVTTGGYNGDAPPYQGHVAVIDLGSGHISHVWNSLCSNRPHLIYPATCPATDSAIWARAGAVIEPGSGRILVATGNGPFNGSTNWGDSVLELTPNASRLIQNWTPANQTQLNASDSDLGSTAPALLPPLRGRRLAVQGGKNGYLYLLDLARLNGVTGHAGRRVGGAVQQIRAPGGAGVFTAPAVWSSRRRTYVFVTSLSGTSAYVVEGRQPRLHVLWSHRTPGTSPVVAGGLLYVFDPGRGRLDVLRPHTGSSVASLPADGGHWNSPIVVGGRIILPVGSYHSQSTQGTLLIYHLHGR
jgi:outer membrane protein assembly factor BamB